MDQESQLTDCEAAQQTTSTGCQFENVSLLKQDASLSVHFSGVGASMTALALGLHKSPEKRRVSLRGSGLAYWALFLRKRAAVVARQ